MTTYTQMRNFFNDVTTNPTIKKMAQETEEAVRSTIDGAKALGSDIIDAAQAVVSNPTVKEIAYGTGKAVEYTFKGATSLGAGVFGATGTLISPFGAIPSMVAIGGTAGFLLGYALADSMVNDIKSELGISDKPAAATVNANANLSVPASLQFINNEKDSKAVEDLSIAQTETISLSPKM